MIGKNNDDQEKRARQILTRPEPTIIGNCDSWNFIVGKKPEMDSPKTVTLGRCRAATKNYTQLINMVDGSASGQLVGELWTICWSIFIFPHRGV
ncbi:MAG: hypothetical protein GZ093_01320 [Rhodoferax sp.]|uniref:hypothetical protein n=1 Tax=Rhodoferax sp. TaxID=50421 RepID=UPI0013FFE389|nr:hypothetical protein [Rhodoferax sp.]NDP37384.1 hypothetical protein [Rhodoferax sp.]